VQKTHEWYCFATTVLGRGKVNERIGREKKVARAKAKNLARCQRPILGYPKRRS